MDSRTEMREFLASRRARVDPVDVGFPAGGNRRVPGLRREELASLAGVSVSYYTRLERGDARGVSESVLDSIARTLRLDAVERTHLYDLARAAHKVRPRRRAAVGAVRPALQQMLDGMADLPAVAMNDRSDIVAANELAKAVFAGIFEHGDQPNQARYIHLDPGSQAFFRDWEVIADYSVAMLRVSAGQDPFDRDLTDLIGELVTRSDDFRARWAAHDVHEHQAGMKRIRHAVVGDLDLNYEAMRLTADAGLRLVIYSAAPSSPTADGLRLLNSWATPHRAAAEPVPSTDVVGS